MRTARTHWLVALILVVGLVATACQPRQAQQPPAAQPPPEPQNLLEVVMARGKLIVATDPNYPPQSYLDEVTKEWTGFDIEVAREIAKRLGVELEFVTPAWDLITAGNWADRWDLSVGSMTITPERMQGLYFTQPYYTTPAQVFVHKDNTTFSSPADLSGKSIGVCGGCTYEDYLKKTLAIPGETITFQIDNADIRAYETDVYALEDLALGDGVRLHAVITALPTGVEAINAGKPIKALGDPVFFEYLAAAVDRNASKDPKPFVTRITEIIQAMHADGTLKALSEKYYGVDLTEAAARFELPPQWQ